MPASIPSHAAARITPLSCTTIDPPISTASIAVSVVCPSEPLPPFIVRPAEVSERWLPGSRNDPLRRIERRFIEVVQHQRAIGVAICRFAEIEDRRRAIPEEVLLDVCRRLFRTGERHIVCQLANSAGLQLRDRQRSIRVAERMRYIAHRLHQNLPIQRAIRRIGRARRFRCVGAEWRRRSSREDARRRNGPRRRNRHAR